MWNVPSIIKIIDHLPITTIFSKYLAVNWKKKKKNVHLLENWQGFGDTVTAYHILDHNSYVSTYVYRTSSLLSVMCGLLLSVMCGLLLSVMCGLLLCHVWTSYWSICFNSLLKKSGQLLDFIQMIFRKS